MGTINKPQKVKLFAGIIAVSGKHSENAIKALEEYLGETDVKSPAISFDFTDYYAEEMGGNLVRMWVGFKRLVSPEELAAIKIKTNEIEEGFSPSGKRQVNIDPGYITHAKVVLASTKDFSHRIYLSGGIYGEVTLIYRHKAFVSLEWTYPDYKCKTAQDFFGEARKIFAGHDVEPNFCNKIAKIVRSTAEWRG